MAKALRLLFEWTDGTIRLKSARPVDKRAPAGDPPERQQKDAQQHLGIVLELRDGDRALYRRQVGPLFPDSHEVQTGDPARPFSRVPRRKPFTVEIIVPAYDRPSRVVLTERSLTERPGGTTAKRGTPRRPIVHVDEALKHEPSDPTKGSP